MNYETEFNISSYRQYIGVKKSCILEQRLNEDFIIRYDTTTCDAIVCHSTTFSTPKEKQRRKKQLRDFFNLHSTFNDFHTIDENNNIPSSCLACLFCNYE